MNQFSPEEQTAPKTRRHRPWSRALLSISGVLVIGAIAAACSSSSATPTTAAQGGGGGGTTATLVSTTKNTSLGTILVNNKGFTLYTLSGNAPCDAACSAIWPPLMVTGSASPNLGSVAGLGTVKVSGGEQVTDNGMRLYTFVEDKSAGQATGQGLKDTWGTWSVVVTQAPTAPPASTTPTTRAKTTTTTAAGGGGGVGF
jgi:predicted lipoprotein with Yx(FWY)xxD motif